MPGSCWQRSRAEQRHLLELLILTITSLADSRGVTGDATVQIRTNAICHLMGGGCRSLVIVLPGML